jgi:hypothetical protein
MLAAISRFVRMPTAPNLHEGVRNSRLVTPKSFVKSAPHEIAKSMLRIEECATGLLQTEDREERIVEQIRSRERV